MSTLKVNTIAHNTVGQTISIDNPVLTSKINIGDSNKSYTISPFNLKNKIYNGNMSIGQRTTSPITSAANNSFAVDRFRYVKLISPGVCTINRDTDVPTNSVFNFSLKTTVTTADSTVGATDRQYIKYGIEGLDILDLVGNTFTLSFWVKAPATGTYSVALGNSGTDRSYIADYTISAANTWEFKTITVTNGLTTAGTWDYSTGLGLAVNFPMMIGSDFKTATVNSWVVGNFLASTNMTNNVFNTNGNVFSITGVQLELGEYATNFELLPISTQLDLLYRYCQRVFIYATIYYISSGTFNFSYQLKKDMRAIPTYVEQSQTLPASFNDVYLLHNGTTFSATAYHVLNSASAAGGSAFGYIESEI